MSKKSLLITIILILAIIFALAINNRLALRNSTQYTPNTSNQSPQSTLKLSPQQAVIDPTGNVKLSVILNTYKSSIKKVSFELFYDPNSLKLISIEPDSYFANAKVVKKEIHDKGGRCCFKTGKILYNLELNSSQTQYQSYGEIVNLLFQPLKQNYDTEVRFLDASIDSEKLPDSIIKPDNNSIIKL